LVKPVTAAEQIFSKTKTRTRYWCFRYSLPFSNTKKMYIMITRLLEEESRSANWSLKSWPWVDAWKNRCTWSWYLGSIPSHQALYTPVSRRAVLCDWVWRTTGERPHRFPHNNFISVYRIFTKLDHMIPLWKGKNPIYFGVKGHRYYKYNFWQQGGFRTITLVLYIGSLPNLATWFPCGRGRSLFILGSLGQRSRSPLL
jgi:hypothetical protein